MTTPAERALIDYALEHWEPRETSAMARVVNAVRCEQTWPGALNPKEARERYPMLWTGIANPNAKDSRLVRELLDEINRARADGARLVQAAALDWGDQPGTWDGFCSWIDYFLKGAP